MVCRKYKHKHEWLTCEEYIKTLEKEIQILQNNTTNNEANVKLKKIPITNITTGYVLDEPLHETNRTINLTKFGKHDNAICIMGSTEEEHGDTQAVFTFGEIPKIIKFLEQIREDER